MADEDGEENNALNCERDTEELALFKRFSQSEWILRLLSLFCLSLMVGMFIIQLNIAWKSREMLLELGLDDSHYLYPDFYLDAHSEETWCWDPDTMLLKVNTSLFVR